MQEIIDSNTKDRVNLFILGVNKAGTSWLYYLFNQHPDIYMSKAKEHYYFGKEYPENIDGYHKYFPFQDSYKYFGEATPSYYYYPEIAKEIKEYSPEAKLLIIVRDPIQRLLSHYYFRKQTGLIPENVSFEEAVFQLDPELLASSHYEVRLPAFEAIFGPDQLKIVSLEKGKSNLSAFWQELQEYLNLEPAPIPESQSKPENATGSKKFRGLYRSTILPIKLRYPAAYKTLLQFRFMYWAKNILLKVLGTADKDPLSEELILRLQREFAPTYQYLSDKGFGDTYDNPYMPENAKN